MGSTNTPTVTEGDPGDTRPRVLGRPVTGEIQQYGRTDVEQGKPEDFMTILDEALDFPGVDSVRWRQYTPYFNDGEPCEFSIYGSGIKLPGVGDEDGDYGDGYLSNWEMKYHKDELSSSGVDLEELSKVVEKLTKAIEGGAHYIFLKQSFGDPAEVTATKEGFNVEFYEHD